MRRLLGTLTGKAVAAAVRLRGRSAGQAMPGRVVERLVPGYLAAVLVQLPRGVVMVTGTNGKTTTTKMVVEVLRANGLRVLTNATGSNMTRGIISSVSQQARLTGRLPFDIAVFELDEAYAPQVAAAAPPAWVLALNASRDQLDRFGEVDTVARLITSAMRAAGTGVVVNGDDPRLSSGAPTSGVRVERFGVAPDLLRYFPRDDELVRTGTGAATHMAPATVTGELEEPAPVPPAPGVELLAFDGDRARYRVGDQELDARLQVTGQHNFQNGAAALALVHALLPDVPVRTLVDQLADVRPAFGRGQVYTLPGGAHVQLNLVKNPASFRQGLASYVREGTTVVVAVNDLVADGRDLSWLWDVDFSPLAGREVAMTTGIRAVDMALRLRYDDVPVGRIEPDLEAAVAAIAGTPGETVVFSTYTAMLRLHTMLSAQAVKGTVSAR